MILLVACSGEDLSQAPSADVARQVARDTWMRSGIDYCGHTADDQRWPCARVTAIDLAGDPQGDGKDTCFYLTLSVEITPWDPVQGIPSEPRRWIDAQKPVKACGSFSLTPGEDPTRASSWFLDQSTDWFTPVETSLRQLICSQSSCPA